MNKEALNTALPGSKRSTSQAIMVSLMYLGLVVIVFVALRFWKITTYSLWGGDAFTVIGSGMGWRDMFAYIVADIVHPPLIYILLKIWMMVGGQSLFWLKLFPVVSSIAMVVPFFLLCRALNLGLPETTLALLLTAVNGYLVHYAQEIRMYSMFAFLSLCSYWLFIRFFKATGSGKWEILILTLVNLLTIYTHYYGWLVVGMEFLFLLIWRRKILPFALSMVFLALVFSPWAFLVIQEARSIGGLDRNLNWIPKPGYMDLLTFYATLNGPLGNRYLKLLGILLFGLPLVLWLARIGFAGFKTESDDAIAFSWLAILSFVPVVIIYFISQGIPQAVWVDRYFIFIAAPYLILVAVAVYRLQPKWLRNVWIAVIVLWSVSAGIHDLRTNRMAWTGAQLGARVDWESLALNMSRAETQQQLPVKVYTMTVVSKGLREGNWTISTSLDYYLDLHKDDRFEMLSTRDANTLLARIKEDHFWIAYFEITDWIQPPPAKVLAENGYQVGEAIVYQDPQLGARIVLQPVWRK